MSASTLLDRAPIGRWSIGPSRAQLTLGLVIVALAARMIGLNERPLWLDEAYSAWFASRDWHYLWTVVPTFEPHPPFYYSILKLWRSVAGDGAVAMRMLSVLLGLAVMPVTGAAVAEHERLVPTGRLGLQTFVALVLIACSPMLLMLDQEARPYPLLILGYSVASLGLLRLTRDFAEGSAGQWSSWLLLAAGSEITLWAHALGCIYVACLSAALAPAFVARASASRVMRGLIAAAGTAAGYIPCLVMMLKRASDWGTGWLSWRPSMLLDLLQLYAVPIETLTVVSAVAALVVLLLIKRSVQLALAQPGWTADRALLILWLAPPIICAIISATLTPIFLTRTLAPTLFPAFLMISSAAARTKSRVERNLFAAALLVTLLPAAIQTASRPPSERWDEVSAFLNSHVRPGDQIWVYPNDSALPLEEAGLSKPVRGIPGDFPATRIKGTIRAGSPAVLSVTPQRAAELVADPSLASTPTVWLVTRQTGIFDPQNDMPNALAGVRRRGRAERWGYISIEPFTVSRTAPHRAL